MTGRPARAARAILAVALLAPAACGSPGVSNGSLDVCYRAIPVADDAIHDKKAHLVGVHRVPVERIRDRLPASAQNQLAAEDDTTVCALSYKGHFAAGQVDMADPGQTGGYALVLVSSRRLHLVGAVVLDHLPRSLGGRTL